MTWTDDRISDLIRLWDAGHTASHIGTAIGVSKNAVIGKAHRLKLPPRPSPIRQSAAPKAQKPGLKPGVRPGVRPGMKPAPLPAHPPATGHVAKVRPRPVVRAARAVGGASSCLWPIGDPATPDFHFCGAEAVPGKPYCDEHCARAYVVTRPRAEPQAA